MRAQFVVGRVEELVDGLLTVLARRGGRPRRQLAMAATTASVSVSQNVLRRNLSPGSRARRSRSRQAAACARRRLDVKVVQGRFGHASTPSRLTPTASSRCRYDVEETFDVGTITITDDELMGFARVLR